MWVDLNPKAVTTYELFGFINPATREWKDGIITILVVFVNHWYHACNTYFKSCHPRHKY